MSRRGKRRSRPVPDAINIKQIIKELERALKLEDKYRSNLLVAGTDQRPGEVALTARDIAVQNLRFLKFWLHLPTEVFLTSVSLLDRFLTKMKVKERYLACVAISCLYIAAEKIHMYNIDGRHLVNTSQTKCSLKDMERMCDIICKKLEIESRKQPVTVYTYLNLFLRLFESVATEFNVKLLISKMLQKKMLQRKLEVVMSNYCCASERHPIIVIALVQHEVEKFLAAEMPSKFNYYSYELFRLLTIILKLKNICAVNAEEFDICYNIIKDILKQYDDNCTKQKMNWRFPKNTLFSSPRPLDNYRTNLNRISEDV